MTYTLLKKHGYLSSCLFNCPSVVQVYPLETLILPFVNKKFVLFYDMIILYLHLNFYFTVVVL